MKFSRTRCLRKTQFNEVLIRENALNKKGFKEWLFYSGMLFDAPDKWWGDRRKRDRPHEGLDLCLYSDRLDRVLSLDEKTKIPVMYDGTVVRILNDFLGKSIIMEHGLYKNDNSRFCTIYGHTNPYVDIHAGRIVKEGDIIATLADSSKLKTNIIPHLHISLGWISEVVSYDKLDWETIAASNTLTLLNPLHIIDWRYRHYRTNK